MSTRGRKALRATSKELENAVREEREKWRIFRLQQVREQGRSEASRVRGAVQRRKEAVVKSVQKELLEKWQEDKENEVQKLQKEYDECVEAFGKAHDHAKEQPDAEELLAENMAVNKEKAAKRGSEAAKAQRESAAEKDRVRNQPNQMRKSAVRKEKLRASRVAQLPTPKAFVKEKVSVPKPVPTVQLYEHGTLTTTSYVNKNFVAEKEIKSTKPTAHQLAEMEENALIAAKEAEMNKEEINGKKREERGKKALDKARLHQEYHNMLEQLDQAHRDHFLSGFLNGLDQSIFVTEDARKNAQLNRQQDIELAVEKILEENTFEESKMDMEISSVADGSDLQETAGECGLCYESESPSGRQYGHEEFQEEIRKQRLVLNNVLNYLDGSPKENAADDDGGDNKDSGVLIDDKTVVPQEIGKDSDISAGVKPRHENVVKLSDEASGELPYFESRRPPTHLKQPLVDHRLPALDHRLPFVDYAVPAKEQNHEPMSDIHFKETMPAYLMPENRKDTRRGLEDYETISSNPSSEGTLLPGSSEDIDIKIHFSSDNTSTEGSPGSHIMPTVVGVEKFNRKYLGQDHSSSTEYLSLPPYIPPTGFNETHLYNLQSIQQKRHKVQRLIDECRSLRSPATPVTYMQEMGPADGSGQKPVRKRDKFEMRKKELMQFYLRKLLSSRKEDLQQISASTVDGSGLTVNSMFMLPSLNTSEEDSDSVTLVNLTNSSSSETPSSPHYPDIDQIPTKLTKSRGMLTPFAPIPNDPILNHSDHSIDRNVEDISSPFQHGLSSHIPKVVHMDHLVGTRDSESISSPSYYGSLPNIPIFNHPEQAGGLYDAQSKCCSSSSYISVENIPLPTHRGIHKESSTLSSKIPHLLSRPQISKFDLPESSISTEISFGGETTPYGIQWDVSEYERQYRALLELQKIQKLKQELIKEKTTVIKESEDPEEFGSQAVISSATAHLLPDRSAGALSSRRYQKELYQDKYPHPAEALTRNSGLNEHHVQSVIPQRTDLNSRSYQKELFQDINPHSGEVLTRDSGLNEHQVQSLMSYRADFHTTQLRILPPEVSHDEDLVSESEKSENNVLTLNPELTDHSCLASSGPTSYQENMIMPVITSGGTAFTSLTPIETVKSELSGTVMSSSAASSNTKVGGVSPSALRTPDDLENSGRIPVVDIKKSETSDQENEVSANIVLPAVPLEQDRIESEPANMERAGTSPVLSDEGNDRDQGSGDEKFQSFKENFSKSSSSVIRSKESSLESVTSMPDMAEVMQRFGFYDTR